MFPRSFTVGLFALALTACAHSGPAYEPVAAGSAAVVQMGGNLRFHPHEVKIRAGETVEWRNRSIMTHTVDGPGFSSGEVRPGQVWSHRFTTPGRYDYICRPHGGLGMKGVVVVS